MRARIGLLLGAALLAAPAGAAESVAEVFAVDGSAQAGQRELARGDAIEAGELVRTGPGSRAALFAGDIYVQLDPDSAVRFSQPSGGVQVELEAGRARIVDTRGGGQPGAVAAGFGRAPIAGGDKEIYLLSEKTGRYAMFCDWTQPLAVAKGPNSAQAHPGECVLVKPDEAPYASRGHDHQIPLLPVGDDVPADALAQHFDATDVASGPFHGFPGPYDAPDRERDPCDIPGSGCQGDLVIIEPPPDPDFCAPGVICDNEGALNLVEPAPDTSFCAPGVSCPE
jgi:hypothetical protein